MHGSPPEACGDDLGGGCSPDGVTLHWEGVRSATALETSPHGGWFESGVCAPPWGMEGRSAVNRSIVWETDFTRALERAGTEGKPVLLDFFNPE